MKQSKILPWPEIVVQDNKSGFKWKLKLGDEESEWYSYYQGILVHRFKDGRTFGAVSAYFEPSLPELKPFQIFLQETPLT